MAGARRWSRLPTLATGTGSSRCWSPEATLADDGTGHDLTQWADRKIFSSHGRMKEIVSISDNGRALVADYRNDTAGLRIL